MGPTTAALLQRGSMVAFVSAPLLPPTILLVDDEPDILESFAMAFKYGIPDLALRTANTPAKALDILKHEKVAAIVSDFRMPGMDGIQFLKAAGTIQPGVPKVMFSAYADPNLVERACRDIGGLEWIGKPVDMDRFVSMLRRLLRIPPSR